MSSINNTKTNTKKKGKEIASEIKKMSKKKKDSQIDVKEETFKSKGERVEKMPKKPKILSVIDLVLEKKK